MNIRLLFTLMIALLALTACNDKDEPDGSSNDSAAVYVSLQDNGQWYICSLDGEIIYQAEPNCDIRYIVADGQDWYAAIDNRKGHWSVVKNGAAIYSPTHYIHGLGVYHGDFFTLESETLYTYNPPFPPKPCGVVWRILKNGAVLYELDDEQNSQNNYSNLRLHPSYTGQPDVLVTADNGWGRTPWVNGKPFTLPDVGQESLVGFDVENNEPLLVYWEPYEENDETMYSQKYWHNGKSGTINNDFMLVQAILHQGSSYLLGTKVLGEDNNGFTGQAVVIVNGREKPVNTGGDKHQWASQLLLHGNSMYVMTASNTGLNRSYIYKDNKLLDTDGTILQPNGKKVKLRDLYFKNFIVVDRPSE